MDPATLIGILLAFGSVYAMLTMEGSQISSLLLPPPMILVFGATIAASVASTTISDAIAGFKALPHAFKGKVEKPGAVIDQLVGFAEIARKDGLLALEKEASTAKDPLVKAAMQNIADGTDQHQLRILLEDMVNSRSGKDRAAAKFFNTMGGFAPTVGIVGTVVSLTHVLENLSQPAELGHMIASAFVATLWGLLSANFLWLPIGARLGKLADLEAERMNLVIEGAIAVQSGSQPRLVGERLRAMVHDGGKPSKADAKGGAKKADAKPAEKKAA